MSSSNGSATFCLNERQMMLAVSEVERVFIGMIVPALIVFGISGNILNLTVLLNRKMRTRSNLLLASLAVADIVFLVFMLPHSLAHYKIFAFSFWYRQFYLRNKVHLLAILNWASAAAIWFTLVICLERLIGIKYPLSVRKHKRIWTPTTIITSIVVITGFLTSYYHFSYVCITKLFCNGTQVHSICIRIDSEKWFPNQTNSNSDFMKAIAHWAPHVNAIFVVVIPIFMVLVSNAMLIYTLRERQKLFMTQQSHCSIKSDSMINGGQSRTEHKVTRTVCAIVTCFTITQGPSAIITVMASYHFIDENWVIAITAVITTMVVSGKAINFVLFCLSSANFRSRLLSQTKRGILRKTTRLASLPTVNSTLDIITRRRSDGKAETCLLPKSSNSPPTPSSSCTLGGRRKTSQYESPRSPPFREVRRGMSVL